MTGYAQQAQYQVRFEWGLAGLASVAQADAVVVVVDVLSFSTAVSVALARGASVLPFPWKDERATEYAHRHAALLAGPRGANGVTTGSGVATASAKVPSALPAADGDPHVRRITDSNARQLSRRS